MRYLTSSAAPLGPAALSGFLKRAAIHSVLQQGAATRIGFARKALFFSLERLLSVISIE